MAEYATFYEVHDDDNTLLVSIAAGEQVSYSNVVYDTVLGGGSWQRWSSNASPDTTGTGYNAATGGSTGDWKAGSYSFEVG